ncbi:retrovirus-related pol polyprotein from transposon TNT 1-94 [Tanacetum coccineum]
MLGSLCYPRNDRDDLRKMKPNADIDNNVDESIQEYVAKLDKNTFINPFCTPVVEEAESSLTYQYPSNMHEFYQQHCLTDKWTKNHPIEQVIGNPSKHVMIRSQLHTDAEMCMYVLTMSTTEPTNIKEAILDHNWIELMMDEMKFFLGLQIHQSPCGIFISQSQYTLEILKKHGMDGCDSISTPIATARINADLQDIAFATFSCTRYQARPTEKHLKEVKRICSFFKCLPFELPEDVVNKTLQIILELQFFKLSLFDLCCHNSSKTFQQPFISAIKSYSFRLFSSLPVSHLLWSSQSFGHQKGACPWSTENHFNSQYMKHWASQSFGT